MKNSLSSLLKSAQAGDANAQFRLGYIYGNGDGVEANQEEAARWYLKAAQQGHPEALGKMGFRYQGGHGLPENPVEAVKWYKKGVAAGDLVSVHNLAIMYLEGRGIPKDDAEAVRLLTAAAEQGLPQSQYHLGITLFNGEGALRNQSAGIEWLKKAESQGLQEATTALGEIDALPQSGAPDHSDTFVSIRSFGSAKITKIKIGDLREMVNQGKVAQGVHVRWVDNGPWQVLDDFCPTPESEAQAAELIRSQSAKTILETAALQDDYNLIKGLMSHEPEIAKQKSDALVHAVRNGHARCVRLLVTRGASLVDMKVIDAACERDDPEIYALLNPTKDRELARAFEGVSQTMRESKEGSRRLGEIHAEIDSLKGQMDRLPQPNAGNDGVHVPKCPTCGSTDLERITLASKGFAALLVGVFAIGHASKTWSCKNCQYKW